MWVTESFDLQWRISLQELNHSQIIENFSTIGLSRCHSSSFTGEFLVYGGMTSSLLVWNLFEKRFLHEIQLAQFDGKDIVHLEFVHNTTVFFV